MHFLLQMISSIQASWAWSDLARIAPNTLTNENKSAKAAIISPQALLCLCQKRANFLQEDCRTSHAFTRSNSLCIWTRHGMRASIRTVQSRGIFSHCSPRAGLAVWKLERLETPDTNTRPAADDRNHRGHEGRKCSMQTMKIMHTP